MCVAGGLGTAAANAVIKRSNKPFTIWQRVALQSIGATVMVWLCFLGLTLGTDGPPEPSFYYIIPFYIWIISLVICGFGELMRKPNPEDHTANARAPIFERLKPALRSSEIYALSAEDHYVRVHTSKGDELILMRLSDAVKETTPLSGLQTHRSWWIAEAGVREITKNEGKLGIYLRNDVMAPVSRSKAKNIRDANWV